MKSVKKPGKPARAAWSHRRFMFVVLLPVALVGLVLTGDTVYSLADYYNRSAALAHAAQLRNQIMAPYTFGANPPATDFKTGDLYFPEMRLQLPKPTDAPEPVKLSYSTSGHEGTSALNVTHMLVLQRVSREVQTAQNSDDIYAALPHLGACSRGVLIVDKILSDNNNVEMKHAVDTADGRTIYVYLEKQCPELATTADLMAKLRSY